MIPAAAMLHTMLYAVWLVCRAARFVFICPHSVQYIERLIVQNMEVLENGDPIRCCLADNLLASPFSLYLPFAFQLALVPSHTFPTPTFSPFPFDSNRVRIDSSHSVTFVSARYFSISAPSSRVDVLNPHAGIKPAS